LWHGIFFALIAAVAVNALGTALYAVRLANRALGLPQIKLRSVESRLQLLEQLTEEQTSAQTDLANRLKMMRVRSATSHATKSDNGLPDPYKEPDRWRIEANKRLAQNRLNGGA
jgi:hypothetical protein